MTFALTKKTSKSRTGRRTKNWINLSAKKLQERVSLNKEGNGLSHFVNEDGIYKGKKVITKKIKGKKVSRV